MILGRASETNADKVVANMEAVQKTKLTASTGTVATKGPHHANLVGDFEYKPAGWNHVDGTWSISAANDAAVFNLSIEAGALLRPVFEVSEFNKAEISIKLNGAELAAGKDFAASVDAARKTLFVTLFQDLKADKNQLEIRGK